MIEACSSCPNCQENNLALYPQPMITSSKPHRLIAPTLYAFACRCGRSWYCDRDVSEKHYGWLHQVGLYEEPACQPAGRFETYRPLWEHVLIHNRRLLERL